MSDVVTWRRAQDADLSFVVETTAKVRWPKGTLFRDWRPSVEHEVRRHHAAGGVVVADASGVLLGFVITRYDGAVTMLYVKRDFRGADIGRQLLIFAGVTRPVRAVDPTPSFRAWARHHQIQIEAA